MLQIRFLLKFYFTNKYRDLDKEQVIFWKKMKGVHKNSRYKLKEIIWDKCVDMIVNRNKTQKDIMTKKEFIEKWNVAFEDMEQKIEFDAEMLLDLNELESTKHS